MTTPAAAREQPNDALQYRARFVAPVDQPPIADGVVTIAGGIIRAVEPWPARESVSPDRRIDLGDAVLLPAPINAHTHLEFSALEQPLGAPREGFSRWIEQVVAYRRGQIAAGIDLRQAARDGARLGLAELQAAATAAAGEIATQPWYSDQAPPANLHLVLFRELLGLAPERAEGQYAVARDFLREIAAKFPADESAPSAVIAGLSPHAPYTVHPDLLDAAVTASAERGIPLAMHLAESWDELELLRSHSGPLVETLERLEAWHPGELPRGLRPLDYLRRLARAARALVVHGNFLVRDEWEFLAQRRDQMSVVYCPRTHAAFPHGGYSLAEMLAAGVPVCLGTDSRASNPDLSVWREAQFAAQTHPHVSPEQVLELVTLAGAKALGLGSRLGSITPGKLARLAAAPLRPGAANWSESLAGDSAALVSLPDGEFAG